MKKGIDVSKWNGDINFRHVANSGVEFVMIRSSYGDGSKSYRNRGVDPLFLLNYRNARDAGSIGVYHYCWTVEEAKRGAPWRASKARPLTIRSLQTSKTREHRAV